MARTWATTDPGVIQPALFAVEQVEHLVPASVAVREDYRKGGVYQRRGRQYQLPQFVCMPRMREINDLEALIQYATATAMEDISARQNRSSFSFASRYGRATNRKIVQELDGFQHALRCVRAELVTAFGPERDEATLCWLIGRLQDLLAYRAGGPEPVPVQPKGIIDVWSPLTPVQRSTSTDERRTGGVRSRARRYG